MISELVRVQAEGYAFCLAAGAAAGAAAGILNGTALLLKKWKGIYWFVDAAVWLVISVLVIIVNYICCDGELRLYVFLGFFSSFLPVFYTINWACSKIVNHILCLTTNGSNKVKG